MNQHLQNLVIEPNPIKFFPTWIRPQMVHDCNGIASALAHALNSEMVQGLHDHATTGEFLIHVFKKVEKIGQILRYMFTGQTTGDESIPIYNWKVIISKGTLSTSIDLELDDSNDTTAISIRLTGVDFLHN